MKYLVFTEDTKEKATKAHWASSFEQVERESEKDGFVTFVPENQWFGYGNSHERKRKQRIKKNRSITQTFAKRGY